MALTWYKAFHNQHIHSMVKITLENTEGTIKKGQSREIGNRVHLKTTTT